VFGHRKRWNGIGHRPRDGDGGNGDGIVIAMKRNALVPVAAILLVCGALISGCGGGGSTPPATATVASSIAASNGATALANSASITLSIALPKKTTALSKRAPAYVSQGTYQVAVTANPSATTNSITCSAGSCSGTIFAPVSTTSLTIKLQNSSGGTLSQATKPVTLVAGQNNSVTFTFDGVVAFFTIAPTLPPTGLVTTSSPTSIPFTITPYDVSGFPIVGPGDLIDGNGTVIVGASGTPQTVTLASSNPAIAPGSLTWNGPGSYTFSGTAQYNGTDPGLSPDKIVLTAVSSVTTVTGSYSFPLSPMAMFIGVDPLHTPSGYTISVPTAVPTSGPVTTTTSLVEIPLAAASPSAVNFLVYANFNPGIAGVSLQSNTCDRSYDANLGIPNAFASPPPYGGSGYAFSFNAYASIGAASCQFTLVDSTNNVSASATVYFNNPQLIIQGKARR
jgi:hypothetical protein